MITSAFSSWREYYLTMDLCELLYHLRVIDVETFYQCEESSALKIKNAGEI
jgi:hypothetical protein